jgi:hypothetical protein
MKPAHVDELRAGRLYVPGLVDGAALQSRWSAIPIPRQAKARQVFGQNGLLNAGFFPARTTVLIRAWTKLGSCAISAHLSSDRQRPRRISARIWWRYEAVK